MKSVLPIALARVFLDRAATWRLLGLTVFGFAFSLAVILGTIGLMDGFESGLKSGLRSAAGDAILTNRQGFFTIDPNTREALRQGGMKHIAPLIQSEAFAISEGRSKAVLVRGIDPAEFEAVTGHHMPLTENGLIIGKVLREEWNLKEGDTMTLVLAKGGQSDSPEFLELQVTGGITHGVYEKDHRLVYVRRALLDERLGLHGKANLALLSFRKQSDVHALDTAVEELDRDLEIPWSLRTAWSEFSGILEAVQVEKNSIAVILQLIVVVAVFNIAAFLVTLRARKTQEYFLLRAVGLPRGQFMSFGAWLLLMVWVLSCFGAWALVAIFNLMLAYVPWLQMPGDVYLLTRLQILLDTGDYLLVFGPALVWIGLVGYFTARRLQKQSLLTGLRQEFA